MAAVAGSSIVSAASRLGGLVAATPLVFWPEVGIWLKCENLQVTGSFKLRGALNKILGLEPDEIRRGLVAASAGNHGIGCAVAARLAGASLTVVVPEGVVARKKSALERLGARVILAKGDYAVAEAEGRERARRERAVWVSPYNDAEVIAGQGTLGLELAHQLSDVRPGGGGVEVYVPVSGGGLLAGVGLGLQQGEAAVRLVGVQTAAAPYMHRYFHGGNPDDVIETPTLADGLAGAVEAGSMTWALCRQVADDFLLVSEDEIASMVLSLYERFGMLVEPSAATAAAACLRGTGEVRVAVLSGGNADVDLLTRLKSG